MASLLSLYRPTSSWSRRKAPASRSGGAARRVAPAPVRKLLGRLMRSGWRKCSAARPRRAAVPKFGYDLQSYSRNFDDGHHRF